MNEAGTLHHLILHCTMSFSLLNYRNAVQKNLENDERITKEAYQSFIAVVTSLCCMVHGFIITQSELLLTDEAFMARGQTKVSENVFKDHFLTLFFAGEVVGALISFVFSDEFGRKTTIMYCCILSMLSIVWYAVAGPPSDTLTARFFVGLFLGMLLTICPVYICEIATAASRGQCVGYLALSMVIGSLMSVLLFYLLEDIDVAWRWSLLVPMLLLAVQAVVLFFLPESPRWVLAQKTPAKCLNVMRQLRRTADVSKEFNEIYRALTSDAKLGNDWWDLFATKSILLRLMLCVALEVAHVFVGMQFISIFGHQLFADFGADSMILGLLLVLLAQLLGTGVFLLNIDTVGRRVLLLSGCAVMGLAWLCAAISIYIATSPHFLQLAAQEGNQRAHEITLYTEYLTQFFFGAALCVYAFSFALSVGSVSWVYCAEIFPYRTRSKAATIGLVCYFGVSLLNPSAYTISIADIGIWGHHTHHVPAPMPPPTASVHTVQRILAHTAADTIVDVPYPTRISSAPSALDSTFGVYDVHSVYSIHNINMQDVHGMHHKGHKGQLPPPPRTVLVQDYQPTYFLLQLASMSLLTGLFVYLCIPETKELRLETMDELFRIENTSYVCGCCPDIRTAGLLGMRVLSEQQKGNHRSATKNHAHMNNTSMSHSDSGLLRSGNGARGGYGYGSTSSDRTGGRNHSNGNSGGHGDKYQYEGSDYEDEELVPSALHKYSAEMRESKFNMFDEDEPLVPTFNLNII